MVALDIVKASNAKCHASMGSALVALFVGGTSGIGEYTLKAFVKNLEFPKVYVVGRSTEAARRIIDECHLLNRESQIIFTQADVSELASVDRICGDILKKEKRLNLLFQTQGNLNVRGRDESPEGLDRKFVLNFYSRMRFIHNLLPLLENAARDKDTGFARSISVLGPNNENSVNFDDLELKKSFSGAKCANHSILMNDFMAEELSKKHPSISFIHSSPGIVDTGIARELPMSLRFLLSSARPILKPFMVSASETAERGLFHATSAMYPAKESPPNAGVPVPDTVDGAERVCIGIDGEAGSGSYLLNWKGDKTGKEKLLNKFHEEGAGGKIWEHTMGIFDRVTKLRKEGTNGAIVAATLE